MLKNRLLFGFLMAAFVIGLVLADGWLDGSLLDSVDNKPLQGSILAGLIVLISIPAIKEMKYLFKQLDIPLFVWVVYPAVLLLALAWYICQLVTLDNRNDWGGITFYVNYLPIMTAFSILGVFLVQATRFSSDNMIRNCGANILLIMYLGFLCSFIMGIRVLWGPITLLMFIFTIKCSDIGAFTVGKLFGRHKLAPTISPGKTWEGLFGAILFATIVSYVISSIFGIMSGFSAVIFGVLFGVFGQMGDLVESMLKRDAATKDSSSHVPGFGGVLDVIDSPLATAPLAYAYFLIVL